MNDSTEQFTQYRYRFDEAEFDESTLQLILSGQLLTVEPRPLQVLAHLLRSAHEVVTKNELMEAVWDGRPTVDNVLANAINKLRKALGEPTGLRIVNVPRIGYKFTGPLDRLAVGSLPPQDLSLKPGMPVPGRTGFQLVRPLDEQGRGHVWLARQPKTGQERVFKFALDADTLRILKREYTLYRVLQQALPGRTDFVPVLDANFAEPPFYMECEYGGPDLLQWAQQDGRLAALPLGDRLAIFMAIAQAVAAAHSVGILHRDLKPANVLMRRVGEAWLPAIADFGSAQPLDEARLREAGVTLLGMTVAADGSHPLLGSTLMYAAPELLSGSSATLQTDVYALGVMLYQLVVADLRRPMTTGWERDVGDPLLVADITAATEGLGHRRLASASELLYRLQTLATRLAEQVAQDRFRQQAEQAQQLLDRRRERRPWLLLAFGLLLVGLISSLWFGRQARHASVLATQQASRAEAINLFLTEDVFIGANSSRLVKGKDATMVEALQLASEAASERFQNEPATEASVRTSLGIAYSNLADWSSELRELQRALDILVKLLPADSPQVLSARLRLTSTLALRSKLDAAKVQLDEAERRIGPDATLSDPELAIALAQARQDYYVMRQDYQAALQPTLDQMRLLDALPDANSMRNLERRGTARARLAERYHKLNRLPEAEAQYLASLGPPFGIAHRGDTRMARSRIDLAEVRLAQGKLEGIEAELKSARDLLRQRLGPAEPWAAGADMILGDLYAGQDQYAQAAAAYLAAYQGYQLMQAGHPNARIARLNMAINELEAGQSSSSLTVLEQERPGFVADAGRSENGVVQLIDFNRARALINLKRPDEALALMATLKPALLAQGSPGNHWPAFLQAEQARAMMAAGHAVKGQALLREAVQQLIAVKAPANLIRSYQKLL